LISERQKSRSLGTKKNRFFAHIVMKSGSIYIKPRPTWSHTVQWILLAETNNFLRIAQKRRSSFQSSLAYH